MINTGTMNVRVTDVVHIEILLESNSLSNNNSLSTENQEIRI